MTRIAIIGAPTSAASYAPGQELAPAALRAAGLPAALEARGLEVRDLGDGPLQRWAPDRESPRAQNLAQAAAAVAAVNDAAGAALAAGDVPLVLGGNCTVGIGAWAALAAAEPAAALCYVDLHADLNTPASVVDGALDWMGLGCLLGVEGAAPGLAPPGILAPEQVVLVGFDPGQGTEWERTQIASLGLRVVPVEDVARDPADAAQAALVALPSDTTAIALHFDVDLVDFVDAPLSENTGRNVGVPLASALATVAALAADPRVRIVTVTELNPLHGAQDGSTLAPLVAGLADALARGGRGASGRSASRD